MSVQNAAAQEANNEIREAFERCYDADADDPACATELVHFANGYRAQLSKQSADVADGRAVAVLVDELRGHLIEARQVMAAFQQEFVPDFDTPETLTMVPNDALVPFCALLDRLRGLDLPEPDKEGDQQRAALLSPRA